MSISPILFDELLLRGSLFAHKRNWLLVELIFTDSPGFISHGFDKIIEHFYTETYHLGDRLLNFIFVLNNLIGIVLHKEKRIHRDGFFFFLFSVLFK